MVHLSGMVFTLLYNTFGGKEEQSATSGPSSHFQLEAHFQRTTAYTTISTLFNFTLMSSVLIGTPPTTCNVMLDDFHGPILLENHYSWFLKEVVLPQVGRRTRFKASVNSSTSLTNLNTPFDWSQLPDPTLPTDANTTLFANSTDANENLTTTTPIPLINLLIKNGLAEDVLSLNGWNITAWAENENDTSIDGWLDEIEFNQTFGLLDRGIVEDKRFKYDGLLNLGNGRCPNEMPFVKSVLSQVEKKVVTFWLEPAAFPQLTSSTTAHRKALLTFGSLDPEHCLSTGWTYVPYLCPSHRNHWSFHLQAIKVKGKTEPGNSTTDAKKEGASTDTTPKLKEEAEMDFDKSPRVAVLSKTTYHSMGPRREVEWVARKLGAVEDISKRGHFALPCEQVNKDLVLIMVVGSGKEESKLKLYWEDYFVQQPNDPGMCILIFTVKPASINNVDWILGAPFLNNMCASLDLDAKKIGFAPTKKMKY